MKKKVLIGIIAGAILVVAIVLGAIFLMPKDNGEPMYTTTTTKMHTHEFGEWEVVFLPTCEMEGKEQCVCACGETISQAIAKVDHSFGNWEIVNAASCAEEGERKGFCEYCHLEKSETIPATEIHTLSTIVPEFDYCGEEQVRSVYCSVCEEYVTSFGHHYIKSVIEATCTEDGEIRYTCDKCGDSYYTVISAHGHIESDEQITMNPTCEGQGIANVTCIVCDTLLEVVTLESTGHEYTCTSANGKMIYTCTKCNYSYYEAINDNDLSVTFMSDGEEITKVYVAEGTAVTYMPTLTKQGYDLAYWAIDDGTNAPYDSQCIYEDTVLVAVWEEVTVLDTHYSDISNFPSVETSFTFKVVAENEDQIKDNLTVYDIEDNEIEYSVRALGGGKYEISSDNYCEGEFYYAIAEGNVTFVGTESREIQFSIEGENRVEIEISDSVKWLEYSDVYGVIDGVDGKLLLTKDIFNVGDNVAIFEDSHESIVLVIKILSKNEQMGYNAYGFEMADYDQVFDKFEASVSGDLSDGVVTINPEAEDEIRAAFMSSTLYASARAAAVDLGKSYRLGINKEELKVKLAINSDYLVITVKYTIQFEENIEINITCKNTYYIDAEFSLKSISQYSAILTTTNYQSVEINLSGSTNERDPKFSDAKKAYLENLKKYLENKKEDFIGIQPSNFEKNDKYIAVGGVNIYVGGVNLRFSLGVELNFEASGKLETELRMTTTKSIGVRNDKVINSLDIDITGIDFYVQGKARIELLLRTELFINVMGIGIYGNVALGPYIEFGGVGAFSYDGDRLYITQNSAYIDAGHRQEINVGFKAELFGIIFYQKEFEVFGRDHSFNGMPIGSTEIWLGFEEYEGNVYIDGDCSSNNQFDLDDLINTTIKYQDLKGDLGIEYLTPDSVIHSLNSVSGYRSRITFTNDKITFNSIGEEVTLEIKVKVNDLIYKTVVVHYTVNHEDGCSHYSCDKGYHVGGTTTCTERAICSRCDIEYGPEPVGHNFVGRQCSVCEQYLPSEGLAYELLDDGTYSVVGIGECQDSYVVIPSTYLGVEVTAIGENAFKGLTQLQGVEIPDGVITIGDLAFSTYTLTSVKLGRSVTSIGIGAFYGCVRLTSISIPDSVTSIGRAAFANCNLLTTVTINSVSIEDNAFSNCESLTTVTIGNSVESIGQNTFSGCESLTTVTIGNSVNAIGAGAFGGCESLTNITIPDSVTSIGYGAFMDCRSLTSITIPNSVTGIGSNAFMDCYSLVEVCNKSSLNITVGSSDNGYIGWYAKHIIIDESASAIKYVDDYVFFDDGNNVYIVKYLDDETEIVLPEYDGGRNYSICQYMFYGCESLVSVTMPDFVIGIEKYAFYGCVDLTSVILSNNVTSISEGVFGSCESLTNITIPDSVTSIGEDAFIGCRSLTNITIPNQVISIGWRAFSDCRNLKRIIIPDSVTILDGYAFQNCTSLMSVTIGDSVISIRYGVFYNCTSLKSITIPNSINGIGEEAFENCTSLESIMFEGTVERWNSLRKGLEWNYNSGRYTIYCNNGEIAKSGTITYN